MNTCSIKSATREVNEFLDSYKNGAQYAEDLTSAIESRFGKNIDALLAIRKRLTNEGLYTAELSNYIDEIVQCKTFNSSWESSFLEFGLLNSADESRLFKSNFKGIQYVRSFLTPKLILASIVDTRRVDTNVVQSSEDLQEKIVDLKNELCEEIYNVIRAIDPEFELDDFGHCFSIDGADSKMYALLITKAIEVCENCNIKHGDIQRFDFTADPFTSNFISSLLTLTNFDYYVDSILVENKIIAPIDHKGYLHNTEYLLLSDYNNGRRDLLGVSDEEYDDASKAIAPDLELIIKSIPYVDVNFKSGKRTLNSLNKTLSIPNILLFGQWLLLTLPKLGLLYANLSYTDIVADPISTLHEILSRIHESLVNWSSEDKAKRPSPLLKEILKSGGINVNVAMSLYEYYFNSNDRLKPDTISISDIEFNQLFKSGSEPIMLLLTIAQQLVSSAAPAYIEHNQNGSIVKESELRQKNPNISIDDNYKLKALKNQQYFAVKSLVRSFLLKSVLNSGFDEFKDLIKENDTFATLSSRALGKKFIADLFLIDINDFPNLLLLINEFISYSGLNGKSSPIMKGLRSIHSSIVKLQTGLLQEGYNLIKLHKDIEEATDKFVKAIGNLDDFSNILAPIFSSSPVPTFIDRNGNQLGVYRNTSLIFALGHLVNKYKINIDGERIGDPDYLPLRERTNIFAKAPQLLQLGSNKNYQSSIAIPLTLGTEVVNTEARKLPEFVQDARLFLGEYLSLMCSQQYNLTTPMFAFLAGTYSDKMSLPEVVINALTACIPVSSTKAEAITQLLNTDRLNLISYLYESTNKLDLLNHVISDLYTTFNYILNNTSEFNLSLEEIEVLNQIRELLLSESSDSLTITNELLNTGVNGHSNLFRQALLSGVASDKAGSVHAKEIILSFKNITDLLYDKLNKSTGIFNLILRLISGLKTDLNTGYNAKENFIYNVLNRAATICGVKIVDKLHFDKYGSRYEMNKMLLQDVKNACTFSQQSAAGETYYAKQAKLALNKKYIIRGKEVTFKEYLSDILSSNRSTYKTLFALSTGQKLGFAKIYDENGLVDQDVLETVYTKYLSLTSFLRHLLLDITVKEAYVDGKGVYDSRLEDLNQAITETQLELQQATNTYNESKTKKNRTVLNQLTSRLNQLLELREQLESELLEAERSNRQLATTKRNNTFTGTYKLFVGNTLFGINNLTKICMIEDIEGGVFNQLYSEIPYFVTEFDGGAMTSPIQTRMEDFSLGKKQRTSIKKTFITPIGDYSAEELKWASDEMTNKLIRESQHCKIPLLEMFRRMHDIPFDYDITKTWDLYPVHNISEFLGRDYYTREGFDYVRYTTITSLGNNRYSLTREKVDINGNKLEDLPVKEVTINTIYDIYDAFDGINSMSLGKSGVLDYSEAIMDLLYKFTTRVGEYRGTGDSRVYRQSDFYLPLRDSFIGILATHSSNKRGAGNLTSKLAWFDKDIKLNYYQIDLTTGGELLDATHTADRSEITKGTQMLQALAQKGYDENLVKQIYMGLAAYMSHSSELFTIASDLVSEGQVDKVLNLLILLISRDLEFGETTLELRTLLECLQEEADAKGEQLSLPLSLLLKEVINSIAPDVNRLVIKQKDSGLMGTLGFSSGFVQRYHVAGTTFNHTTLVSKLALEYWSRYKDMFAGVISQMQSKVPGYKIDDLILNLEIARLNMGDADFNLLRELLGRFKKSDIENIIEQYEISENDAVLLLQLLNLGFTDNTTYNLALLVADQSEEGLVLLKNLYDFLLQHDANLKNSFLSLEKILPTQINPGESVLVGDLIVEITSNKNISDIVESGETVYSIKSYPVDLMPNVLLIVTESGYSENQYTSRGTRFNQQINSLQEFKQELRNRISDLSEDAQELVINSIIQANSEEELLPVLTELVNTQLLSDDTASYITNNFSLIKSVSDILDIANSSNEIHQRGEELTEYLLFDNGSNFILKLLRLLELMANFDNWIKSFGFVFKNREGSWSNYYDGLDFTLNLEHQIQLRIVAALYSSNGLEFEHQVALNLRNYLNKSDLPWSTVNGLLKYLQNPSELIQSDPWFIFNNLLPENKHILYYRYFSSNLAYEHITGRANNAAEIVMPPIYRGLFKLGHRDIVDIDLEFFKKAPTFYRIKNDSIVDTELKRVNVDLVCRTFNKAYNIVVANDQNSSDLDKYGKRLTNVLFDGDYRLDPRSHKRLYKLDKNSNYQIRIDQHGVETIIFFDKPGVYDEIINLLNSDLSIVTVQPFLTNLLWLKSQPVNIKKLLNACRRLDSLSVFERNFDRIEFYVDKISLVNSLQDLKSEYDRLGEELYNLYLEEEGKYKERYAKASFISFLRSLDVVATRIPTQNMSSIMAMKIAAFTDNNVNNVFVTKWQQWLLGSDYDIDKAFILGYNFTDDGKFITWSPLLKMYEESLFEVSLAIPLPTGKILTDKPYNVDKSYPIIYGVNSEDVLMHKYVLDYIKLKQGKLAESTIELYVNAFNAKLPEDTDAKRDVIEILLLTEILKRLEQTGEMRIPSTFRNNSDFKYLVNLLNEQHLKTVPLPEGEKNQTTWLTHQIISNPKYSVTTYKSIDIATDAFLDPLSKIKSTTHYNIDDGHTISSITVSGATGKDDVGIGANGTKVYFTELSYFNDYYLNRALPVIAETETQLVIDPHFDLSRFKFEYTDYDTGEFVESKPYIIGPISDTILTPAQRSFYEYVANQYFDGEEFYLYDRDAAQDVGALLSMAADNAKNLALDKLNATTDYFAMHIYLAALGISPETIIGFFRSTEFRRIIDLAKNDLLSGDENRGVNILDLDISNFNHLNLDDETKERLNVFLDTLKTIYKGAQEMTSFSRILSSNLGIKIETSELNTIKRNTERVFNDAFKDYKTLYFDLSNISTDNKSLVLVLLKAENANRLLKSARITLLDKLNFERFLNDKLYLNAIIAAYDVVKLKINVFDAIVNAPHFLLILKSYNTLLKIYTSSSHYLDLLINKSESVYNKDIVLIQTSNEYDTKLFSIPNYSRDTEAAFKLAYDDLVLKRFFIEKVAPRMSFEYRWKNASNRLFGKDFKCDFSTNEQLYEFMEFFNSIVFPTLLLKYGDLRIIRDLTFNYLQATKENNFVLGFDKNILMLLRKDNIGGSEFMLLLDEFNKLCSIPLVSLIEPDNEPAFKIADKSITIGDAMYCYFTLAKRISPTIHSLSPLFSGLNKRGSIKMDFVNLVIDLDKHRKELSVPSNILMAYVCKQLILYNSDIKDKRINFTYKSGYDSIPYNLPIKGDGDLSQKTILLSMKVDPNQLEAFELAEYFRNCYLNETLTIAFNEECN